MIHVAYPIITDNDETERRASNLAILTENLSTVLKCLNYLTIFPIENNIKDIVMWRGD